MVAYAAQVPELSGALLPHLQRVRGMGIVMGLGQSRLQLGKVGQNCPKWVSRAEFVPFRPEHVGVDFSGGVVLAGGVLHRCRNFAPPSYLEVL